MGATLFPLQTVVYLGLNTTNAPQPSDDKGGKHKVSNGLCSRIGRRWRRGRIGAALTPGAVHDDAGIGVGGEELRV